MEEYKRGTHRTNLDFLIGAIHLLTDYIIYTPRDIRSRGAKVSTDSHQLISVAQLMDNPSPPLPRQFNSVLPPSCVCANYNPISTHIIHPIIP